jgi:magnesium-transporting ATPase (P-type)
VLEGDVLINECALTGESVPVLKKAEKIKQQSDIKTSFIYEGTSLIQVGNKKKMVKFERYR